MHLIKDMRDCDCVEANTACLCIKKRINQMNFLRNDERRMTGRSRRSVNRDLDCARVSDENPDEVAVASFVAPNVESET